MSVNEEKKTFIIKHTFTDVKNMKNDKKHFGKQKKHFNIPWNIYIVPFESSSKARVVLSCHNIQGKEKWSCDTTITCELVSSAGVKLPVRTHKFYHNSQRPVLNVNEPIEDHLVDGNLTVKCLVTINKTTGIEFPMFISFCDDQSKEFSDVVLKVLGQKFYVLKMYLAAQSTYFKSLFLGKFDESSQSEIELKDIDPYYFQKFLEVLYANPDINDDTVEGILELADMFNAEVVIQQCEKFLVNGSKLDFKEKFLMATQYMLDDLKKKCMPEFKTFEDIASVIPEDPSQLAYVVWKELLNLSIFFHKQKNQK